LYTKKFNQKFMNYERRADKILVFELNGKNVFCGMDATRIIFSPQLHLDYLPEQHFGDHHEVRDTMITLGSAEQPTAQGLIIFAGNPEACTVLGWEEFFAARPAITEPKKRTTWDASWFSLGDSIEIIKDDWEESESSMDHLLSQRTLGSSFAEVFFTNESVINQLTEFFSITAEALGAKKVIFETYPGDSFRKFF
jgi:hypothetical protein